MNLPKPRDVVTRNKILGMEEGDIDKEIKRMVKKLNGMTTRLEELGLAEESMAYSRISDWSVKYFGRTKLSTAIKGKSKKEKATYLTHLYHFETFHLTKSAIEADRERMRKELSFDTHHNFTNEELRNIRIAMKTFMESKKYKNVRDVLREVLDSEQIREIFIDRELNSDSVTKTDVYLLKLADYVKKLVPDKWSDLSDEEKNIVSGRIPDYIKNYDPMYGTAVYRDGNYLRDYTTGEIVDEFDDEDPLNYDWRKK